MKRHLLLERKAVTNLDSILKSRDITLSTHVHIVKARVFPVVMYGYEGDYKEGWALKNWCFWILVLEKTLESLLALKNKPVNLKGNQPCIFTGRTDAEVEAPILWLHDEKSCLIGEDPGKDWRQEEKGATEDKMIGRHYQLNGHEFEQTLRDSERQGKCGMLQSMGSQRVGHGWATEQQQIIVTATGLV